MGYGRCSIITIFRYCTKECLSPRSKASFFVQLSVCVVFHLQCCSCVLDCSRVIALVFILVLPQEYTYTSIYMVYHCTTYSIAILHDTLLLLLHIIIQWRGKEGREGGGRKNKSSWDTALFLGSIFTLAKSVS